MSPRMNQGAQNVAGNFALANSVCACFYSIIRFGDDVRYEHILQWNFLTWLLGPCGHDFDGWKNACSSEEEGKRGDGGWNVLHKTLS